MIKNDGALRRAAVCVAASLGVGWVSGLSVYCAQDLSPVRAAAVSWLTLDPAEYGAFVEPRASGDNHPAEYFQGDTGPLARLAELPPLRGIADRSVADSHVEPASFVDGSGFADVDSDPRIPKRSVQEELDSRQPLTLVSSWTEILAALEQQLKGLERGPADVSSEEWAKRIQAVRDLIGAASTQWDEAQRLAGRIAAVGPRVAELRQLLVQPAAPSDTEPFASVAEAQAALDQAKQSLQQSRQSAEQAQAALQQREQAKEALDSELSGLRAKLAELVIAPAAPDEGPLGAIKWLESRAALHATRSLLLRAENQAALLGATPELDQLELDAAQRLEMTQQSRVEALEDRVNQLRRLEVQQQAEQAEREAAKASAQTQSLAAIAEHNSELVQQRGELTRKLESLTHEINSVVESSEKVKQTRQRLEEKIAKAGMNRTIGALMLVHRRELPPISTTARRIKQIDRETPEIQLAHIELEDRRDELVDLAKVIDSTLAKIAQVDGVEITPEIRGSVEELFATRRQLVQDLIQDVKRYIDQLAQFSGVSGELIEQVRASQLFVDKHVLWIRSNDPLNRSDLENIVSAFGAVIGSFRPDAPQVDWRTTARQWTQFALWSVLILAIGAAVRNRLARLLAATSQRLAQAPSRSLGIALQSLALMLLVAAFWPAAIWAVGQYLSNDAFDSTAMTGALGRALMSVVPFLALGCVIRQVTLRAAFAEQYLAWHASAVGAIHRAIVWYLVTVLPLRGAGVFFDHFQDGRWASAAGRSMFILSQIGLFVCLNMAVRQVSASLASLSQPSERGYWLRTRRIWSSAIVLAPLALAALSLVGYHYSASELAHRLSWTLWLILGAMLVVSLAQQIVQVVLNKMSIRQFWLARAADERADDAAAAELDLERVGHQIGRLLRGFSSAGVVLTAFLIWSQVLPAVQILDQVELWSVQRNVVETQLGPDRQPLIGSDGSPVTKSFAKVQNVTLADLAWAAICLGLTVVLSRNLPGLLEVTLLDRLPLDRGGKYAISVVCRYLVAIAGFVLAARCLGLEWSSVQWLVAAMSVGLGFGLQEIFGNFVSGMIILLERPIRVGDLVTVNGTTGYVTRIQLRATTITDADRREMIVPNKKFITDDVINWTLTDSITRMVIPVGVAYGSDTELACATLLEIARANPHVLTDPEPNAVFTRFGASSLDLELRVHLPSREHFPDVQHELHLAIDRAFRERNIEIAFPQQDIHIRPDEGMVKALLQARHELKQQTRKPAA
jgi:potassium efflux system protein